MYLPLLYFLSRLTVAMYRSMVAMYQWQRCASLAPVSYCYQFLRYRLQRITGAWWAYNYTINFMEVKYPFINNCNRNVGFKSRPANSYERISFLPKLGLTLAEF